MTRWTLSIPDEDDRRVRQFLARDGGFKKGDLSAFVVQACCETILRRTVAELQERNADLSEAALKLAREAVAWARAHPA